MTKKDVAATPPRGTRLTRDARRKQLLRAAQDVFVNSGYHAAAMDEIAERAGVSKPVLYQHFPGKMELYLALLDDANEQISEAVLGALNNATTDEERVAATMEAYFEFVSGEHTPYRLVFESDLVNDEAVRERLNALECTLSQAIAPLLIHHTEYTEDEGLIMATAIFGMAQQSARFWQTSMDSMPMHRAARLVAGLALMGIKKLPKTFDEVDGLFTANGTDEATEASADPAHASDASDSDGARGGDQADSN